MTLKIVELYPMPTVHVDDFCDHQVIGDKVHAIGYEVRREPNSDQDIGVAEVRLVMTAKKFFAVCRRGVEMEKSGQMPQETAFFTGSHH